MIAATHFSFAAVLWWLLSLGISLIFLDYGTLCFLALGALMPDIDEPRSAIGWVLFPLAWFLRLVLNWGHRQQTHSMLGLGIFALIFSPLIFLQPLWWFAFCFGYLAHLVSDMMTKSGVPLLWPLRRSFVLPANANYRIKTGSVREWMLLGVLMVVLSYAGGITRPSAYAVVDYVGSAFSKHSAQTFGKVEQVLELENLAQLKIKNGDIVELGQVIATLNPATSTELAALQKKLEGQNFGLSERQRVAKLEAEIAQISVQKEQIAQFRLQELEVAKGEELNQIALQEANQANLEIEAEEYRLKRGALWGEYSKKIAQIQLEIEYLEQQIQEEAAQEENEFNLAQQEIVAEIEFLEAKLAEAQEELKFEYYLREQERLAEVIFNYEHKLELANIELSGLQQDLDSSLEQEIILKKTEITALEEEREDKIVVLVNAGAQLSPDKFAAKIVSSENKIAKLELEIEQIPQEIANLQIKEQELRALRELELQKIAAEETEIEAKIAEVIEEGQPREILAPFRAEVQKVVIEAADNTRVKILIRFAVLR